MRPLGTRGLPFLALGLAVGAAPARAQEAGPDPLLVPPVVGNPEAAPAAPSRKGRAQPPLEAELRKRLKLSDAQAKSLGAILSQGERRVKAVRDDASLSEEDRNDRIRALVAASHDQIRALLTPTQQAVFDVLLPRPADPPPAPPLRFDSRP